MLPDGCMDLLWDGRSVVIAGPTRARRSFRAGPGSSLTGLRFAPGFAPRVLGLPADELTDQRVPLDAVWARRPGPAGHGPASPRARRRARALETIALRPLRRRPTTTPRSSTHVVALARRGLHHRDDRASRRVQRAAAPAAAARSRSATARRRSAGSCACSRRSRSSAAEHRGGGLRGARRATPTSRTSSREVKDLAGVPLTPARALTGSGGEQVDVVAVGVERPTAYRWPQNASHGSRWLVGAGVDERAIGRVDVGRACRTRTRGRAVAARAAASTTRRRTGSCPRCRRPAADRPAARPRRGAGRPRRRDVEPEPAVEGERRRPCRRRRCR